MPIIEKRQNLEQKRHKANKIIELVEDYFSINTRVITRKRDVIIPRQIAIYLITENIVMSLKEIGMLFPTKRGYMHHSNVLWNRDEVIDKLPIYKEIKKNVDNLKNTAKDISNLTGEEIKVNQEKESILKLLNGLNVDELIKIKKKVAKLV